jgi:hypothetical protein
MSVVGGQRVQFIGLVWMCCAFGAGLNGVAGKTAARRGGRKLLKVPDPLPLPPPVPSARAPPSDCYDGFRKVALKSILHLAAGTSADQSDQTAAELAAATQGSCNLPFHYGQSPDSEMDHRRASATDKTPEAMGKLTAMNLVGRWHWHSLLLQHWSIPR